MAAHRLLEGDVPRRKFVDILPTVLSDDDQKTMDAIAQSVRAHPAIREANTPEAAVARVWAAEKALQNARRAASRAFEEARRDTQAMFSESTFVLRSSAEKWIAEAKAEAIKTLLSDPPYESSRTVQARGWARLREEEKLIPREPQDLEARERAIAARWQAATAEERGKIITEAAERHRPLKGK
jgi:hypothetical protein